MVLIHPLSKEIGAGIFYGQTDDFAISPAESR